MPKKNKEIVEFKFKKFDMSKIGSNRVIVFCGKRNTGKSRLVIDYLYHNQYFPMGTVISPTEEYNQTFKNIIPPQFIHDTFTKELLEKYVTRQKYICSMQLKDSKYANVDPRAFLILDDCLAEKKEWINDHNMRTIFLNGRHFKTTLLITLQYVMGITPEFRNNTDYIFICKTNQFSTKKKLYDNFCGMFRTFEEFSYVLDKLTDDYGCMVINNVTSSDKLEDQVYWYKADIKKAQNFRICDNIFWDNLTYTKIVSNEDLKNYEKNVEEKKNGISIKKLE